MVILTVSDLWLLCRPDPQAECMRKAGLPLLSPAVALSREKHHGKRTPGGCPRIRVSRFVFPQKQMQSKDSTASRVFRKGFWKLKYVHEDVEKAKEEWLIQ